MGLDMYLQAHLYLSAYKHSGESEKATFGQILDALNWTGLACEHSPAVSVNLTVAYWRKSNQIHKWFVDQCQDGIDDCREAYVDREKLIELRDLCKSALETKDGAKLPTVSGFFFGGTDQGEWYWQDIADTEKQLSAILTEPRLNNVDFLYHSSW